MSEHVLTVKAHIADDHTVWLTIGSANAKGVLGVYGPYDSRDHAEVAAREAVAHVARQMQKHKDRLLAQMIDV